MHAIIGRVKELMKCAAIHDIPLRDVFIVNDEQLQDGMHNHWPEEIIVQQVISHYQIIKPAVIVTFDEKGVSQHPNHIATHYGVRTALNILNSSSYNASSKFGDAVTNSHSLRFGISNKQRSIQEENMVIGLKLISGTFFTKFCSCFLYLYYSTFLYHRQRKNNYHHTGYNIRNYTYTILNFDLIRALRGLMAHSSQSELYRIAFILFSSHTYVNAFTDISS